MKTLFKPLVGESAWFGVLGVGYVVWAVIGAVVLGMRWVDYVPLAVSGVLSLALAIGMLVMGLKQRQPFAMLAELRIFVVLVLFFLVVTPVYWVMSHEVTGSVALVLTFMLSAMLTLYLLINAVRYDARPEDRRQADIVEGAGELGFFPPRSAWPVTCAVMLAMTLLGPVFGWWLTILGTGLGLWAIAGWVYQYYRGDYAH
ncbi:cytochrome c oxidase subunit 4 [Desertihabitans aurantiacus]|uniref:cytochrome c oxidase subunit 4 n=1 Tax=Desertihabitans aurantiacus TaxID=2282477 RepID=UPI001E323414|nr:cytochrome c oxidase subunit 4 [Desertihabitans aurantiacus]